jgi:hypothetical protein
MPVVTANGGIMLLAYQLAIDDGLFGDFTNITSTSMLQRTQTINNLTTGRVYRLKYSV